MGAASCVLGDNDIKGQLNGVLGFLLVLVNTGIPGQKKSWKAVISFRTGGLYRFEDDVQRVQRESTSPTFTLY